MSVVPFRRADHDDVLRLRDATFGGIVNPSSEWQPCQQVESLESDCAKYVYREGEVRGYAAASRLDETHFRLNLLVAPRSSRRGIGTLLLGRIDAEVRQAGGEHLQARLLEGIESGLAFARARGFREIHRMRGMSLSAADFECRRWVESVEKFSALGFSLTTLSEELESGASPFDKLAGLHWHAREGWPSPDPTQESSVATPDGFRTLFEHVREPGRFVIVKRRGEYVGYTSTEEGPGTAVHPTYRNLGVAKYMKAHAIKLGIDAGRRRFETCSASPSMQRVNTQLGYKFDGPSEIRLVKDLRSIKPS